ncbi:hypothetical protein [Clostridium sp.]|uniref:hypothetical protein n=1 Tax=Clostridium sp. TaxID=1506 RepID=UPI001D4FED51|nr:hypothetical protein [Clostridium sp.]MBS5937730.1 hypothetical protein [Clostridium sp.]
MVKKGYERIDITFSINNEKEMELLKWIECKCGILNKSTLIKQMLYEIMIKEKSSD